MFSKVHICSYKLILNIKNMSNKFSPTLPQNRIELLDVLRGLAIVGVLICNIPFFSGYYYTPFSDLEQMSLPHLNSTLINIVFSVFLGKFYPILCILFGAGLYMQFAKSKESGFLKFFVKRMIILLLIGIVHQTIWPGDVVTVYALFAFLLIPFRNLKPKTYLIFAGIMFAAHFIVTYIDFVFELSGSTNYADNTARIQFPGVDPLVLLNSVQEDGFSGLLFLVKTHLSFLWTIPRYFKLSPSIVFLFLIGGYLYGSGFLTEKAHKLKYLIIFLVIGLVGSYLMFYVSYFLKIIGDLFISLTYISLIAIMMKKRIGYKIVKGLIPFGRMALTNYIMQSVICIIIFYGVGFGNYGKLPLYGIYIIAIFILVFQIQFSKYWLRKFQFGPIEGIWRSLSYKRKLN